MLFTSPVFLFGFLPAALIASAATCRFAPSARLPVLLVLSGVFYAWWDWRFGPLLAASVTVNWLAARLFLATGGRWVVPAAIALDLGVLGLFKYEGYFAGLANGLLGARIPALDLALPLGISFFTFHHIMYLVDLRRGAAPPVGLVRYGLYIGFFPQVLSGPLVRWREILHQFDADPFAGPWRERMGRGVLLLVLGLGKKVLVADPFAAHVDPVFRSAAAGAAVTAGQAWDATLAFTLQIYFDFSGYTDMALGVALMFGIVLPQNFDAPYRSASLQEFWRRWHMTLSRFLRDYLYVPLGGNRHGISRRMLALFTTMLLGGLWHGAGTTFVAWGAAHGAGLALGVGWRRTGRTLPVPAGWALTLGFVALTWILFRAPSFPAATAVYRGLLGFAGAGGSVAWLPFGAALVLAIAGPTSWALVHSAAPRRSLAVAAALLALVELLKIADDGGYEFIYFQF